MGFCNKVQELNVYSSINDLQQMFLPIPGYLVIPFCLIDLSIFYHETKGTKPDSPKINFLHWKLHAFYSAISTSCTRHDADNVKKRRKQATYAP